MDGENSGQGGRDVVEPEFAGAQIPDSAGGIEEASVAGHASGPGGDAEAIAGGTDDQTESHAGTSAAGIPSHMAGINDSGDTPRVEAAGDDGGSVDETSLEEEPRAGLDTDGPSTAQLDGDVTGENDTVGGLSADQGGDMPRGAVPTSGTASDDGCGCTVSVRAPSGMAWVF